MFGLGLDETREVVVLDDVEITIEPGNVVYVTGQSGSGKSVLLSELKKQMSDWLDLDAGGEKVALNKPLVDCFAGELSEALYYGVSSTIDGTEISKYEIADQQSPNWAKAQLTVRCGYYHSPTGR